MSDEEKIEQIISDLENGYEFNPSSIEEQRIILDMKYLINLSKSLLKNNEELRINNRMSRENNKRLRNQNKQLKVMKMYRIVVLDMMGFRINELFFNSLEKARSEYAKILIEYRNKENIVKRGDESHLSNPIVRRKIIQESVIKEHMIELWYKSSYECDEWDTSVESIQLEIIDVT